MNVLNIPLFYIAFERNTNLEKNLEEKGFTDINWFPAINGKKRDPDELLQKGIISARAYDDLVLGREQSTGLPTLGAVGCTLSHNALWKKCSENYESMIIVEEDLVLTHDFTEEIRRDIRKALQEENGVFITMDINRGIKISFIQLQMYFVTKSAAKVLHEKCLPIEMQTDWYMSHLASIGDINVSGYQITKQKNEDFPYNIIKLAKSSVQNVCFKCVLPKNKLFYVGLVLVILLALYTFVKWRRDIKTCSRELKVCKGID